MEERKKKRGGGQNVVRTPRYEDGDPEEFVKSLASTFMFFSDALAEEFNWFKTRFVTVNEQNEIEDFKTDIFKDINSQTELAQAFFFGEQCVPESEIVDTLNDEERSRIEKKHKKYKHLMAIPRKHQSRERVNFIHWRNTLSKLIEEKEMVLTPYERNIESWRQLWRVVEKSDVVVQIVDARNPLLFYCEDLEKYSKEVDKNKTNLLLLNKSDLLNALQRKYWAKYFDSRAITVAFYSAKQSEETIKEVNEAVNETIEETLNEVDEEIEMEDDEGDSSDYETDEEEEVIGDVDEKCPPKIQNSSKLLTKEELISLFKTLHGNRKRLSDKIVTVGLVGYPNVGKSSTINTLLTNKRVSVSSSSGRTKHLQTLFVDKELMLCDCPGLVMPSFVFTRADLIINGILPIDQMRDHRPPVNIICSQIPRHILEDKFSIMITKPLEDEDPNRPPTADEFLNAYACSRGYMTANGQPDGSRAARVILKHYVNGRLLFCVAPPTVDQTKFHSYPPPEENRATKTFTPFEKILLKPNVALGSDLDKTFFKKPTMGAHSKGMKKMDIMGSVNNPAQQGTSKPWKDHKEKRNKHEKLRRQYRHLDTDI